MTHETTLNEVMEALLPYGSADMHFLAKLCTKYGLDIHQVVEEADSAYPRDDRSHDRTEINIYIREALEQALKFCKTKVEEAINNLNTIELFSLTEEEISHIKALSVNLRKFHHFLDCEGYDKIYTNCMDSGFNSELITDELLQCKDADAIIDWAENQNEEFFNF